MPYFEPAFIQFFEDLQANNHREWFHANKKRYVTFVKDPFRRFVQDLIDGVEERGESIQMDPRDATFRINRDIRFSKDKSPYKLQMSALISAGGKKSMDHPGLYVELKADRASVYSGAYKLDKEALYNLRNHIATHPKRFAKLLADPKFVETFGRVQGEQNKRIPKEFVEAADQQALIYNKNFYYFAEFPPTDMLAEDWLEKVLNCYDVSRPVGDFILEGIGK